MRSTPHLVLTPRERDVVRGWSPAGRTARSRHLDLGEQAVKNVLSTVYQKCHVRNRLELACSWSNMSSSTRTATR